MKVKQRYYLVCDGEDTFIYDSEKNIFYYYYLDKFSSIVLLLNKYDKIIKKGGKL